LQAAVPSRSYARRPLRTSVAGPRRGLRLPPCARKMEEGAASAFADRRWRVRGRLRSFRWRSPVLSACFSTRCAIRFAFVTAIMPLASAHALTCASLSHLLNAKACSISRSSAGVGLRFHTLWRLAHGPLCCFQCSWLSLIVQAMRSASALASPWEAGFRPTRVLARLRPWQLPDLRPREASARLRRCLRSASAAATSASRLFLEGGDVRAGPCFGCLVFGGRHFL